MEDLTMPELIYVRAADPARICAWERHPAHPGGEVAVTGTAPVQVAETSFILGKLASGDILRAEPPSAEEPAQEKPPATLASSEPAAPAEFAVETPAVKKAAPRKRSR
jgi:hypothetical protein